MPQLDVGTAAIAYTETGSGPPVLLIHGWPLDGRTWRKLTLPGRRLIMADSPGAGATTYTDAHEFRFRGQAEAYARFVDGLGLDRFDIVAHDTGATIARELALIVGARVKRLAMINTEIPGHRPPWIQTYQKITALPGAAASMQLLLRSRTYLRSSAGFGGAFCDLSLLDNEFHDFFIAPLVRDRARLAGQIRYLRGIDWEVVDSLATRHKDIAAETLFVWGEDDPTFPLSLAKAMVGQLAHCRGIEVIPRAKLLVHEERPDEVSAKLRSFLS
jgi:haloalkane dehalogenase